MPWSAWTFVWNNHHLKPSQSTHVSKTSLIWEKLLSHREHRSGPSPVVDICDLVEDFGQQKCMDAHDRVYALLGLTNPPLDIDVDYQRPPAHVFREMQGNGASSGFYRTVRLLQIFFPVTQNELLDTCRCTGCDHSRLCLPCQEIFRPLFIRYSGPGTRGLSPSHYTKPFKHAMDASLGSENVQLLSLWPIQPKDHIINIMRSSSEGVVIVVKQASSVNEAPCLCPAICRYPQSSGAWPQTSKPQIPQETRVWYCLLTGMLTDPQTEWRIQAMAGADSTTDLRHGLLIEGLFNRIFEWMSAFARAKYYFDGYTITIPDYCETLAAVYGYRSIAQMTLLACKELDMDMRF
jgi:hypothetical protein